MKKILVPLVTALAAGAAAAQDAGDPAAGEELFNKRCQSCHVIANEAGEVLAGRAGRTGPNLYAMVGRQAGSVEGFRYKKSMVEAGEAGLVWTEEQLAAYLLDPTGFLRDYLDDSSARSGMSFKFRKEQEAADTAAFLASFGSE